MVNNYQNSKFLSHRLRGFSEYENSSSALHNACKSNIPYLEVDTRTNKEGEIYIYHNSSTTKEVDSNVCFSQEYSEKTKGLKYRNGENILSLKKALKIFRNRVHKDQKLCIDIKDYGFEENHFSLVKEYDLEESVIFISWIPQVLISLYEMGTKSPLVLSHFNLIKYGIAGNIFVKVFKNLKLKLNKYVYLGEKKDSDSLENMSHGFQHAILYYKIPQYMKELLIKTKGGICVPKQLVNDTLMNYCNHNDIQLWIFSVNNFKDFSKYSQQNFIDVIFSNNVF